jgi:hypothetical protein
MKDGAQGPKVPRRPQYYPKAQIRQGADRVSAPTRPVVRRKAGRGWARRAAPQASCPVSYKSCRRCLSNRRLRRESHSRRPYPIAKPTIRAIAISIKWHQRLVLQAGDFVLHQQLATLQLHDVKIVDRRMRAGFDYFRFQGPMPSFQFRKMRCYGHTGGLLSSEWAGSLAGESPPIRERWR